MSNIFLWLTFVMVACIAAFVQSQQQQQLQRFQQVPQEQQPQVAYPIYAKPMYQTNQKNNYPSNPNYEYTKQVSNEELRQLVNQLNSHESPSSYFSRNKRPNVEAASARLESHGRKTSLYNNPNQNDETSQCRSRISIEPDKIIDSKASTERGARFMGVEKIALTSNKFSLTEIQETCIEHCCNTEGCDSSLLSLKLGAVTFV
jgi:hypothetical protein